VLAGLVAAALTLAVAGVAVGGFDVHPVSLVLTVVVSLAAFATLGVLAGAVVLVVKRGNPLATLLGMVGAVTAGAYAPVSTFPGWLQGIATINPMTYAIDAWRGATLSGAGPGDVAGDLAVLAVVTIVVAPIGWWSLRRAVDVARRDGTLVTY
jgi:ABC-2 type transport system permease protein